MKYPLILIGFLVGHASIPSAEADNKSVEPNATPIMVLYKKQGVDEKDCEFTMTVGLHSMKGNGNSCTNDENYYFAIRYPREGLAFTIHSENNCPWEKGTWSYIKIVDPIPGVTTDMLSVEAGKGVPAGSELAPGVVTLGYKDRGKMEGTVSCIDVFSNG
ncbi:hypothetical protein [Pseudomonas frederiksbergensis]|uniref:hypothetical protein n=1 Tax=Pseudomonas frederiksbergensis TaxID=104087 RepID=UPI003D2429E6